MVESRPPRSPNQKKRWLKLEGSLILSIKLLYWEFLESDRTSSLCSMRFSTSHKNGWCSERPSWTCKAWDLHLVPVIWIKNWTRFLDRSDMFRHSLRGLPKGEVNAGTWMPEHIFLEKWMPEHIFSGIHRMRLDGQKNRWMKWCLVPKGEFDNEVRLPTRYVFFV